MRDRSRTKGERREAKRRKKRAMGISGKSLFLLEFLRNLRNKRLAEKKKNGPN